MTNYGRDNRADPGDVGAALLAGVLLYMGILLLIVPSPSFIFWKMTWGLIALPIDDSLALPIALLMIGLFCWRSITLYRRQTISLAQQLFCLPVAAVFCHLLTMFLDANVKLEIGW